MSLISDPQLVRKTTNSAGYELYCLEGFEIQPGNKAIIETGVRINLPLGYYAKVEEKSRYHKDDFCIKVGAGIIDGDFTGTIKVILINQGKKVFRLSANTSIAQLILHKYERFDNEIVEQVIRNSEGFGSTN